MQGIVAWMEKHAVEIGGLESEQIRAIFLSMDRLAAKAITPAK